MNISSLIHAVSNAIDALKIPLTPIPGILLVCTSSRRPGFSSIMAAAKIMADMGLNENDDIVKKFVYNVVDKFKRNLQDEGVCWISIPPGELDLRLIGGNVGGQAVLKGTNVNYVLLYGIVR